MSGFVGLILFILWVFWFHKVIRDYRVYEREREKLRRWMFGEDS